MRTVTLYRCECGDVRERPSAHWAFDSTGEPEYRPCFKRGVATEFVALKDVENEADRAMQGAVGDTETPEGETR